MKDGDLRDNISNYIQRFGSSVSFIASTVGCSREHFSRWLNNYNYVISNELEIKIRLFIKGEKTYENNN